MAEKNHPLAAWKDTKKRIKGKGAKLFVDWFDDILFKKEMTSAFTNQYI